MESEESIQMLSEVEWLETFIRGMLDKSSWYFWVFQRIFWFLKTQQNLSFDAQIFLGCKVVKIAQTSIEYNDINLTCQQICVA